MKKIQGLGLIIGLVLSLLLILMGVGFISVAWRALKGILLLVIVLAVLWGVFGKKES